MIPLKKQRRNKARANAGVAHRHGSSLNVAKKMPPRVFISSTFTDLKEHRATLFSVIAGEKGKAHAMEFFGARPGAPKEECLGEVRKAHVFVLILGMRYGSLDPESGLSFTHLEYLEAQRLNLPSLIYLIDEAEHLVLPKDVEVGESAAKLSGGGRPILDRVFGVCPP